MRVIQYTPLLTVLLFSSGALCSVAFATHDNNQSSFGARSENEANYLLESAKKAQESKDAKTAQYFYSRFCDRYPSNSAYADALLNLGKIRLDLNLPKLAQKSLRKYLEMSGRQPGSTEGRLALADAYIHAGEYTEALLTLKEFFELPATLQPTNAQTTEAYLLKVEALMGLQQFEKAQSLRLTLNDYKTTTQNSLLLRSQLALIDLKLKLRTCSLFPSSADLEEASSLDQIERKGLCINEAAPQLKELFYSGEKNNSSEGLFVFQKELSAFIGSCKSPPNPVQQKSKKELALYKLELATSLKMICKKQMQQLEDSVSLWNPSTQLQQPENQNNAPSLKKEAQNSYSLLIASIKKNQAKL